MTALAWLIPISLTLGLTGLACFMWTLRAGQYRDIAGDAARILLPEDPDPAGGERPAAAGHPAGDAISRVPGGKLG